MLCLAALATGGATGIAVIALQRHVGKMAHGPQQLKEAFSWLSIGPAVSNFVGPVAAALLIDHAEQAPADEWGFRAAFILMAMLNSLQMGFRTLALEKRSSEVWQVLGAVKTEFGKFGEVLTRVRSQTQTVLNTLDQAQTRTNVMNRALRQVDALPESQTQALLPGQDI